MDLRRWLRPGLPTATLALLAAVVAAPDPAGATAPHCPSADVVWADPDAVVTRNTRGTEWVGCLRANGLRSTVAEPYADRSTPTAARVEQLVARRWLHTVQRTDAAESGPVTEHLLTDLRTGEDLRVTSNPEGRQFDVAAGPGGLITANEDGVRLRSVRSFTRRLAAEDASSPAVAGSTVYWNERVPSDGVLGADLVPRSTQVEFERMTPEPLRRPAGPAQRDSPCVPRGARRVSQDDRALVVRLGGRLRVCRLGTNRLRPLRGLPAGVRPAGRVTEVRQVDGDRLIAYRQAVRGADGPGEALVVLDVATGRARTRRLITGLTEWLVEADGRLVVADGRGLTVSGPRRSHVVATGGVTGLAVGRSDIDARDTLFWTDAAGAPHGRFL